MKINTVTVIGATGTMGANIAGIFASFGNAKVYCLGRDINKVKETIPRIVQSVKADSIEKNLIPVDFSFLNKCVSESDLVFESSIEDINVKETIAKQVASSLRDDAISCTGSSGLSITKIAECYPNNLRKNFFGIHMFNPPYSMTLCELIPTKYSDVNLLNELKLYLSNVLYRTVIEVKDSPAFLANRIGFQFINRAMQYAEKYQESGGIDYIDAILGSFTGRKMPPLVTANFVGLDVHKAIVDNIYNNTNDFVHDTFIVPKFVEDLIKDNRLGKKTKGGLYKTIRYDDGIKRKMVYDISTSTYRDKIQYAFPFVESMKMHINNGDYNKAIKSLFSNKSTEAEICKDFLIDYINYSMYVAKELGDSLDAADDAMATGFNWCPPKALAIFLLKNTNLVDYVTERTPNNNLNDLINDELNTKYDYRKFFITGVKK